jgi:two-component system response regulator FixJ
MEPQVFVVDDDNGVRNSLSTLLNACGYETQSFATATEFLDALADAEPRCLILDLQLPDINGLDLLRELISRDKSMPTIIITGHGDDKFESSAMQQNAVAYFQKPFNTSQLLDVLSKVIAPAT